MIYGFEMMRNEVSMNEFLHAIRDVHREKSVILINDGYLSGVFSDNAILFNIAEWLCKDKSCG